MKKCTTCQTDKELTCFNKKHTTKDGLQNICRECNKSHSKQYYQNNIIKHRKVISERQNKIRTQNTIIVNQIRSKGCSICGEKSICCLDFHHLDPSEKEYGVAQMLGTGYSLEKIKKEIDKCILVCSNCHRKIHNHEIQVSPLGNAPRSKG